MKTLFSILLIAFISASCKNGASHKKGTVSTGKADIKQMIEWDLNTRFTRYEIIEIKPDSSLVHGATDRLAALKTEVAQRNLEIATIISEFESGKLNRSGLQVYELLDSLCKRSSDAIASFEKRRYDRSESCLYVKYLVIDGAEKSEKEEFFRIGLFGNGESEVYHRPCNWQEFLDQNEYGKLLGEAAKYDSVILEYKNKYARR